MRDSCGRNVNYLRMSITEKCNLRCVYCAPAHIGGEIGECRELEYRDALKIAAAASSLGIKKIRYTGGEPLLFKNFDSLIYETALIPGIDNISVTTNGILLCEMAGELKKMGLRGINISIDSLDSEKYAKITRGGSLDKVLKGMELCVKLGVKPLKINVVMMRGINDMEFAGFLNLAKELPVDVRFIELMPIGEGRKLYESSGINPIKFADACPGLIEIKREGCGNTRLYKLKGAKGNIGFIASMSSKFCRGCNKIRITSAPAIKPCLHSKEEIGLSCCLNDEAMLRNVLKDAILSKPLEHSLVKEGTSRSGKFMYQIGG